MNNTQKRTKIHKIARTHKAHTQKLKNCKVFGANFYVLSNFRVNFLLLHGYGIIGYC